MLKVLGSAFLVGSLIGLAMPASAQRRATTTTSSSSMSAPKHELGADLATQFVNRGDGVGGGIQFGAPVDVRWGFLSKSPLNFEVRASFAYDSKGAGGDALLTFSPGVNALYQLKRGGGPHGLLRAPYVTGGVGLNLVKFGAAGTDTQFGLGAGLGTRLPAGGGSLVWRPEGFMTYSFASGNLPSAFAIGLRMGMSFWH
ncbi:MAG TPA: hypothetical protein VLV16_05140 [Gemmatimonadales bacterium]|nr:hypothetical protein [Gemmatimonadales bacterium]